MGVPTVPVTRYADTAVGRIAYQLVGDGDPDLLVLHPLVLPVDLMWDEPTLVRFLERLASFTCSIWFDPRGRGASDPLPHEEDRFIESVVDDMVALLDFLGCERVAVLGLGAGPSTIFAASHPERTRALIQLSIGRTGLRVHRTWAMTLSRCCRDYDGPGAPRQAWMRWPPVSPMTPVCGVGSHVPNA